MAKYEIKPDGKITDEGKAIGWVEGGTMLNFYPEVEVSKQARVYLQRMLTREPEEAFEVTAPPHEGKTLVEVFAEEVEKEKLKPHAAEIPPEPKQGPAGDKDPAYAYWLRVYFPDEFAKRYAGRRVMGVLIPPRVEPKDLPDFPVPAPSATLAGDVPAIPMDEPEETWVKR